MQYEKITKTGGQLKAGDVICTNAGTNQLVLGKPTPDTRADQKGWLIRTERFPNGIFASVGMQFCIQGAPIITEDPPE